MSYIEKEKLIKADIASIENRVRHAFNQGYDLGYKEGKERAKPQEQEPTTKNDLGVDAVSRKAVINQIFYSTDNNGDVVLGSALRERIARLPSVTPQEPRWIPCSEKKPNKGGEYLLWGKICDDDEEEYCFLGDYYEFEEMFGIEKSNYDPHTLGFLDTEIEEYYSVVAWMPLPKAYREVEE